MHSLNLSSASWQFRDASRRAPWRAATVPGCVHRDLLRHGLIDDPFWGENELKLQWIEERDWDYRCVFTVPAALLREEVVELVADGLDTVATVTLNGEVVASTENMFTGYRWDVSKHLRRGRNELRVHFASALEYVRTHRLEHQPRELNDPVGRCTVLRKQQCQFGWDWGPRFVTAGVWRDIRLEAWSGNRLESVRVTQSHAQAGRVVLELAPELARPDPAAVCVWRLSLDGEKVANGTGSRIVIERPQLWWPNGHGAQPLYQLEVEVQAADGRRSGPWRRRIGLREILLDRTADAHGEAFRFVVNGRPIFAKGANWIPAHSFAAGLRREDYARDIQAAAQANMNMLRVWGGGIYESEDFYDLCDEHGLLIWQDFMFACTRYPGDEAFCASVAAEAGYQVRRLRHRACLALWCGNNEIVLCNGADLEKEPRFLSEYEAVFHQTLPAVLAATDTATPYWPGSPWRGSYDIGHAAGEAAGDTHFWDVWHARRPVKDFERYAFRFVSEFGMQSLCSPETQATFCAPEDANIFGPVLKNHQKNQSGNQIIIDYLSRRYRFPRGQDELLHLSQLNQAYCVQTGIEHWRRCMPRTMGALYWQLNDCWPVASWSSIEFTGRWKALHHVARRAFAPALVTAAVPGDEVTIIGNYGRSTVEEVHVYTVYDAPEPASGVVSWDLFHLDGRRLRGARRKVALRYGESVRHMTVDLRADIARHGRESLVVRIALDIGSRRVSEDSVLLATPRFLALPRGRVGVKIQRRNAHQATLTFTSPVFLHRFSFDFAGIAHHADDNYFELYPKEPRSVEVRFDTAQTVTALRGALTHRSLVDTY